MLGLFGRPYDGGVLTRHSDRGAAVRAAELALGEYCAVVQARRRREYPDDALARCRWTEAELAERDRLAEVVDALRGLPIAA